jgi:hypothetical protein
MRGRRKSALTVAAAQSLPLSPLAAVALGIAAAVSLSAATAHAQEYPWCVSREKLPIPILLL